MTETPRPDSGPENGETLQMTTDPHGSIHRYEQPGLAPPAAGGRSRPSRGVVAGLLAASLVVGGLSGLAGAAGFSAVDDLVGGDEQQTSAPAGSTTSTVSDSSDIPAVDGSVEQVASSVLPSVVKINVSGAQASGSGSGIILSEDGEILTNNHVVEVAAEGGRISVSFSDGTSAPAEIVGTDPLTDLAVIQAQDVSRLAPATLGQSGQLDVGEEVVAIGSPFGLEATVTSGIVSALNRPVSAGESGSDTTYPAVQTDAAINPGNSGGPLVNMRGEVVGINSSIRSTSGGVGGEAGSIGLGFAIPLDNVLPIVDQLRNGETPTHARLGVSVVDANSNDGLLTGAGIGEVSAGSAAEGIGLEQGDVITKVDDQVISDSQSLVATIRGHRPGDEVTLTVVRGAA
ncbi:MAG: trypsin-like peptidase domain-containing protein, partial [Nocardioides sp.]